MNFPRITVITVVYNDPQGLEATVNSVLSQDFPDVEYIVVDGGSTDETQYVLEKYKSHFSHFITEEDEGTYDAMNKGLEYTTGEWVIFMNAGDCFFDNGVISRVFSRSYTDDVAIIGGDIMCFVSFGYCVRVKASGATFSYIKSIPCSHQAAFIRSAVHREVTYDYVNFPICADYACMAKILSKGNNFYYLDEIVSWFNGEGMSSFHPICVLKERFRIPYAEKPSWLSILKAYKYALYLIISKTLSEEIRKKYVVSKLIKGGWRSMNSQELELLNLFR